MSFDFDEIMRGAHERVARERGQQRAREKQEQEIKAQNRAQKAALEAQIEKFVDEGVERLLAAGIRPKVDVVVEYERWWSSRNGYRLYDSGWAYSDCPPDYCSPHRGTTGTVLLVTGRLVYAHTRMCYYGILPKGARVLDEPNGVMAPRFSAIEEAAVFFARLLTKR